MTDQTQKARAGIPLAFADFDKPSLHALAYALRHPDTWPKGFVWNYKNCNQCAMGLARQLWFPSYSEKAWSVQTASSVMAREFAMPYGAAKNIFYGGKEWLPRRPLTKGHLWWKEYWETTDFSAVTPEMVADQIDHYLQSAE